jgi:serine/threonine protein kinase
MWGFGIMIIEMITGETAFKGNSEADQLWRYAEVIGLPSAEVSEGGKRRNAFFDGKGRLVKMSGLKRHPGSMSLQTLLRSHDRDLLNLVRMCLEWNQNKRISAEKAVTHPFLLGEKGK